MPRETRGGNRKGSHRRRTPGEQRATPRYDDPDDRCVEADAGGDSGHAKGPGGDEQAVPGDAPGPGPRPGPGPSPGTTRCIAGLTQDDCSR